MRSNKIRSMIDQDDQEDWWRVQTEVEGIQQMKRRKRQQVVLLIYIFPSTGGW